MAHVITEASMHLLTNKENIQTDARAPAHGQLREQPDAEAWWQPRMVLLAAHRQVLESIPHRICAPISSNSFGCSSNIAKTV
jgi:uncharacterized protein (DUF2461 family)